jgi:hypothetical protein
MLLAKAKPQLGASSARSINDNGFIAQATVVTVVNYDRNTKNALLSETCPVE